MAKMETSPSIRELFGEWEDRDVSRYLLACCLGLLQFDDDFEGFRKHKGIFWTNNRISSVFDSLLNNLVELGFLEQNDDLQYRLKKPERTLEEIAYD